MKKIILLIYLIIGFSNLASFSQERAITGKVTASEDGSPLAGVSISVKGTTVGVTSDANGLYKISAPPTAVLRFSFVGFTTKLIPINNQINVDVTLVSTIANLDEVVVTGYGATLKKKETTGATANIKGDVIENLPLQSFDKALQGRMSGVQIQSANGVPGGAVSVRIRGVGSITAGPTSSKHRF